MTQILHRFNTATAMDMRLYNTAITYRLYKVVNYYRLFLDGVDAHWNFLNSRVSATFLISVLITKGKPSKGPVSTLHSHVHTCTCNQRGKSV